MAKNKDWCVWFNSSTHGWYKIVTFHKPYAKEAANEWIENSMKTGCPLRSLYRLLPAGVKPKKEK